MQGPITVTGGNIWITRKLSILGPEPDGIVVRRTSGTERIFHIAPNGDAEISRLTITGSTGGGIINVGNLALLHSTVSGVGARDHPRR